MARRSLSPNSESSSLGAPLKRRDLWVKTSRIISPDSLGMGGTALGVGAGLSMGTGDGERCRFKLGGAEGGEEG